MSQPVTWERRHEAYRAIHDAVRSGIASAPEGKRISRIDLGYSGADLTSLVYKDDAGNILFTLTLSWSGGNLTQIVRS